MFLLRCRVAHHVYPITSRLRQKKAVAVRKENRRSVEPTPSWVVNAALLPRFTTSNVRKRPLGAFFTPLGKFPGECYVTDIKIILISAVCLDRFRGGTSGPARGRPPPPELREENQFGKIIWKSDYILPFTPAVTYIDSVQVMNLSRTIWILYICKLDGI